MLWTIFVILLVLWLLGLVTSSTLGGFIHLLLVIAVVVLVIRLMQGRQRCRGAAHVIGRTEGRHLGTESSTPRPCGADLISGSPRPRERAASGEW